METHMRAIELAHRRTPTAHPSQCRRKVPPFKFWPTSLEVVENVSRTHFRLHWLVVKWCSEQSYSFRQSSKWVKADRAQYVWSSSGPITLVVMTLSNLLFHYHSRALLIDQHNCCSISVVQHTWWCWFLPIDEANSSWAVIVFVSGGWTVTKKMSSLNNPQNTKR